MMKIFTEKELAEKFGVSQWTVRLWRTKANMPFFRTAGRIFYRLERVLDWMEQEESRCASKS